MRRLTLRARLVLLVLAGVLPLLALQLGGVYTGYRQERGRAESRAMELARDLALALEGEIAARVASLEVLAMSRALAAGDLAAFRAQAERLLAHQQPGANIFLMREDGQQVMNTLLPPGAPLPARTDLRDLRRVLETGRPAISDVYVGAVRRRPVVAIEVPVRGNDGRIGHVLALYPTLESFNKVIQRHGLGEGWTFAVLDRAGVRVARTRGGEHLIGQPAAPDFLRAWSAAPEGIVEVVSPEGESTLVAYTRLPDSGWTIAVGVATAELTWPAWRSALVSLAVGLGLLALGLAFAHRIARSVVGPISALGRIASAPDSAAGGTAPVATGLPEADGVAEALLAEARRSRAATASLLDSERRLRLVVAELNHRAKNALATVQALALETARGEAGADPARFASEFGARLRTLARAHDLLTAFSWEAAALDAVVRAGLAPWLGAEKGGVSADPRIAVDCGCAARLPPVSPGQAQALVMALHELATNATKHGALSAPGGRVEVACHVGEGGLGSVIEWRESGGPPVAGPPARRGFGTRLLQRALAHDLGPGGDVALDFDPGGLRATIRFAPRRSGAGVAEPRAVRAA